MSDLRLVIGGKRYSGWTEVHVEKSLEALAGAFEVALFDTSPIDKSRWTLKMGDAVTVYLDDHLIITGYVEDINLGYSSGEHSIRVAGRDKVGDLVDCHRGGDINREWTNSTVLNIIRNVCSPFGVTVRADSSAASKAATAEYWFGMNEGDTIFDTILRLCRKHYIMPITHGDGTLLLTNTGAETALDRLQSGVNIVRGGLRQSNRDRFSTYYTKGFGCGLDTKQTSDYVHPKGEATDPLIARYRPFTILEDAQTTLGDCKARAKAEAALRAGKSRSFEYDVTGWTQSTGQPWRLNSMVQIQDDVFDLKTSMLIEGIRLSLGSDGAKTTLQLCSPEKYKAMAKIESIKTSFDPLAAPSAPTP